MQAGMGVAVAPKLRPMSATLKIQSHEVVEGCQWMSRKMALCGLALVSRIWKTREKRNQPESSPSQRLPKNLNGPWLMQWHLTAMTMAMIEKDEVPPRKLR